MARAARNWALEIFFMTQLDMIYTTSYNLHYQWRCTFKVYSRTFKKEKRLWARLCGKTAASS
jgi:hypothetical protein